VTETDQPLAIDLFCGLGGWTDGLIAEGWRVVGFDIERHVYGDHKYPAQLVLQDVLTIHGSQFKTADLIVASPPCQFFSYTAMPWSRAKALAKEVRADPARLEKELALFNACFRIQREACEAAGRHIPMVVENVRGAIPWVGRSKYNFGSFHLWGDVPALMPKPMRSDGRKMSGVSVGHNEKGRSGAFQRYDILRRDCGVEGVKQRGSGAAWFDKALDERRKNPDGVKNGNDWFGSGPNCSAQRRAGSGTGKRKFAAAMIAKIPETLSRHIARTYLPQRVAA
jgi:hypothetical protein